MLPKAYYEREHIKGAINIPANEDFINHMKQHFNKDKKIIVYCFSFEYAVSPNAAKKLVNAGFKEVYEYKYKNQKKMPNTQ